MAHVLVGAMGFSGLFAFVAGSPFVYISYFGVAPQHYGYLVGLNALAMIGLNVANAQLLAHISPTRKLVVGAGTLCALGIALLAVNFAGLGLPWMVAFVVAYFGVLALVSANAIAGALPLFGANAGTGSAIYGVTQFGLGALSSFAVSAFESRDATVMIVVMAIGAGLALLAAVPLISESKPAPAEGKTHA
jgi:DHA1 family bicyclomycin/chloramphenicol resistance-like MFS transporter